MHLFHLTATPPGPAPEHLEPGLASEDHIWIDPVDPSTLRMRGEVDLETVGQLRDRVPGSRDVAQVGRTLARLGVRSVDGHDVTFADSAALDLICALRAGAQPERLHLHRPSPALRLVLDTSGVSRLIDIHP